jgi:uncharacterized protein (DUF305 family)
MSTHRTTALLAAAVLGLAPTLAACGGDEGSADQGTVPESAEFNDADVDFATGMIPHHAQALMMVDMASTHDLSPEVTALTEQIRAAQTPEIEQMTDWLEDWDQPVPETPRDHANAGHGMGDMGDMGSMGDMPGMMSGEELDELSSARGDAFEEMWLEAMIAHHEGAIEMADEEIADGEYADAVALAEDIASSQQQEIDEMEKLLGE